VRLGGNSSSRKKTPGKYQRRGLLTGTSLGERPSAGENIPRGEQRATKRGLSTKKREQRPIMGPLAGKITAGNRSSLRETRLRPAERATTPKGPSQDKTGRGGKTPQKTRGEEKAALSRGEYRGKNPGGI